MEPRLYRYQQLSDNSGPKGKQFSCEPKNLMPHLLPSAVARSLKFTTITSSHVTSLGNQLPFVLAAVNRVINETIAYDKIHVITVWHCKIYLALKF